MTLETLELQTGPQPTASIVVLHGLGADGNDFVPIAQELDLSAVGAVRFVFPHAPVRPVTLNGGMPMRAWYDILGADLARREDEPGLRQSITEVQALLDREVTRGIAPERTVLMGFSQGCAMALLTGLRAPQRLAGLVGLSGYLPLAATSMPGCCRCWRRLLCDPHAAAAPAAAHRRGCAEHCLRGCRPARRPAGAADARLPV